MSEPIAAGDGAPPAAAAQAATAPPAPAAGSTDGNTSLLDYARRKLRERELQGANAAKGPPSGGTQNQPGAAPGGSDKSVVLSQAATGSAEGDASQAAPEGDSSSASPERAPEPQEEPSGEGEAADEQALPENAPDWLKKRIARFTRQKGELERKLQATESERTKLQGEVERYKAAPAPDPPVPIAVDVRDPAGHLLDDGQIDQAYTQARFFRRWCEDNPEGGVRQIPDGKGGLQTVELTPEQVRTMRRAAEDDIEVHLPKRREYLKVEATQTMKALREFPWLSQPDSPLFAKFRKAVTEFPALRLRPDWVEAAATFVEGHETVETRRKEASKPPAPLKPKAPPTPVIGAPRSAPARVGPIGSIDADYEAAEKAFRAKPDATNFARLDAIRQQKRRQQ
jgi:hypothetical protein